MQERHSDRERYFNEQAATTEKYYLPYIKTFIKEVPDEILEVGCGEGGNLYPFACQGCKVTGVDIAESRIRQARTFFAERKQEGTFIAEDIFRLTELRNKFSLILIHDVIEHIDNKLEFLKGMRNYLAPGGVIFIAFPAWQMPFGGHQQIARSRFISHFPFLHLLPRPLYKATLECVGENEDTVRELLNIKRTRCPIGLFQKVLRAAGFRVLARQFYFINPHYEIKFGLKPRKLGKPLSRLPYIRNFFSTSCFYIIGAE